MKATRAVHVSIVFVALTGTGSLHAQEATAVVKRYIAWRGGSVFERMRSLSEEGEIDTIGMHGTISRVLTVYGRYRQDTRLPAFSETQIVALQGAWITNPSGQVERLAPGVASDTRHLVQLMFARLIDGSLRSEQLASEAREGKEWVVVRFRFDSPDSYDFFIAADTGELGGLRITEDQRTRFIKFSDWKIVDGVRVPFSEVVTTDDTGETAQAHFERIRINAALPPTVFVKPVEKRLWKFAGGAKSTAWIPFEFFNETRIFIPATVGGQRIQVLLDTGADVSTLDRGFIRASELEEKGTLVSRGAGGNESAGFVNNISIVLDNLTLGPLTTGVLNLAEMGQHWGHPFVAVLGKEVFNAVIVDIDFPHRRIAFRDRQSFRMPSNARRVVLGQYLGIYSIPVAIDGRPPVPAMFDLGSGTPLILFPAYPGQAQLAQSRPHSLTFGGGVGGRRVDTITTVEAMSVSGYSFHDVPTVFPSTGNDVFKSNRVLANVGLPVFSRFRLLCNLRDSLLFLVPDNELLNRPFRKDRSGLAIAPGKDGWHVTFVAPGGPAAETGFKANDVIVAMNGRRTTEIPTSEAQAWRWGKAGDQVTLTLSDGSTRQLRLRDYF